MFAAGAPSHGIDRGALIKADDIVNTAARWGHRAIAITDHDTMVNSYSLPGDPVRVITGVELSAVDPSNGRKIHILTGILADKDYRSMLTIMSEFADDITFFRFDHPRAIPEEELQELCEEFQLNRTDDPEEWIGKYERKGSDKDVILCIGSLYMTDRIRTYFGKTSN